VLITMDSYYRSGDLVDHKVKADEAVAEAREQGQDVDKVLVWRRHPGQYGSQTPMTEGRDFFVDEVLGSYHGQLVDPVSLSATDALFLMYTSGTTGRPKGAQHSIGGYLAYVAGTSKYYQDIHPDDTYWCMADIGWITGHSYIVYGPLALGTTSVIYEGTPNYPDAGRPWRIAERLGVNIFHTSPTAIRMLRKVGPDEPAKYNYHFKHMTTVGEPIEPEVWRWYHKEVGKGEAVIVDTWWQTETGGFLGSSLPALKPMKPGSCGPAVIGIYPAIYDENGDEVPDGKAGNICIRNPWPGIMQTIWGQPERFIEVYYAKYNKDPGSKDWHDWPYFAGDGAVRAAGHQGDRIRGADRARGRGGGRGPGRGRHPRPGGGDIRLAQARLRGQRRDGREGHQGDRGRDRQDRAAEVRVDRAGHAQDPVREDHAPGDRGRVQLRRGGRRDHPGQPGGRRRHPPPCAEREGQQGRRAEGAERDRVRGDQVLRG
jgi:acetyl-CoA synthetase